MSTDDSPSHSLPWYKDGLRFKCTECGKCCTGAPGFVWVSEDEMINMARHLKMDLSLFKRKFTRQRDNRFALIEKKPDNSCIFLEEKKCSIYPVRPTQCRTFPWWQENLNTKESWERAALDCEGINNQAPVVPFDEILKNKKPQN